MLKNYFYQRNSNLCYLSYLSNENRKTENVNVRHQHCNIDQENGNVYQNSTFYFKFLDIEVMYQTFLRKLTDQQQSICIYLETLEKRKLHYIRKCLNISKRIFLYCKQKFHKNKKFLLLQKNINHY
jgi:hypothetical protein